MRPGSARFLVTAIVAGCSSSGGGASSGAEGAAFTVSPTSLAFQGSAANGRLPPQDIHVSVNSGTVFVKATVSGLAVESATVELTGSRTATVSVQPAGPAMLPNGVSTGTVTVEGCTDAVCSGDVQGSPQVVDVTYTKSVGGITGSPSSLTFTQAFGGPVPPPQTIALSDLGGASAAWTSTIQYQNTAGWLHLAPASGSTLPSSVAASVTTPTTAGAYNATIQFALGTVSVFDVAVSYTISGAFEASPPSFDVVGTYGSPGPSQQLMISDGAGATYAWSTRIEYVMPDPGGWLTVTPPAGSALPASLSLSLGALPDRATHSVVLHVLAAGMDHPIQIDYLTP